MQDVQERFAEDPENTRCISLKSNVSKHEMEVIMYMQICVPSFLSIKREEIKRKGKQKNKQDESRYCTLESKRMNIHWKLEMY